MSGTVVIGSVCEEVWYPIAEHGTQVQNVKFSNQLHGWDYTECWPEINKRHYDVAFHINVCEGILFGSVGSECILMHIQAGRVLWYCWTISHLSDEVLLLFVIEGTNWQIIILTSSKQPVKNIPFKHIAYYPLSCCAFSIFLEHAVPRHNVLDCCNNTNILV